MMKSYAEEMYEEGFRKGYKEGYAEALCERILLHGELHFGPPTPSQQRHLTSVTDLPRLRRLLGRVLLASSWSDLLPTKTAARRRKMARARR